MIWRVQRQNTANNTAIFKTVKRVLAYPAFRISFCHSSMYLIFTSARPSELFSPWRLFSTPKTLFRFTLAPDIGTASHLHSMHHITSKKTKQFQCSITNKYCILKGLEEEIMNDAHGTHTYLSDKVLKDWLGITHANGWVAKQTQHVASPSIRSIDPSVNHGG